MKKIGKAWAPSHATLIFSVPQKFDNLLEMGSIGGGFNFAAGIQTNVKLNNLPEDKSIDKIFWNGRLIQGKVSITAANLFRKDQHLVDAFEIHHRSIIPIGCGLSTSGAGALGVIYALNDLYAGNMKLDLMNDLAHQADIINHTGLGSVVGQSCGGIEIRLSQGSPSRAKTKIFASNEEIFILVKGPLSTSDVLTSKDSMVKVTQTGSKFTDKLNELQNNVVEQFIAMGKEFMGECGLATNLILDSVDQLSSMGEHHVTMSMIGESLIIKPNSSKTIENWSKENDWELIKTRITNNRPKVVN